MHRVSACTRLPLRSPALSPCIHFFREVLLHGCSAEGLLEEGLEEARDPKIARALPLYDLLLLLLLQQEANGNRRRKPPEAVVERGALQRTWVDVGFGIGAVAPVVGTGAVVLLGIAAVALLVGTGAVGPLAGIEAVALLFAPCPRSPEQKLWTGADSSRAPWPLP